MFVLQLLNNYVLLFSGKIEFDPDEDAHIVGDCVKVSFTGCVNVLELVCLY